MSVLQPYRAWLFTLADDVDEVNREMDECIKEDEPGFGDYVQVPENVVRVDVVALEYDHGAFVWALSDEGEVGRYESWRVRREPTA